MAASDLRTELAATAARLIAEEGCEYAQAKRRAVHELLGENGGRRTTLPDNSEVERELRRYLQLFGGDAHRTLLNSLRRGAEQVMVTLSEFDPHLIGAVLNGTATEHSDIHLQLFVDSAKDVEMRLFNLGIEFDVADAEDNELAMALEKISFVTSLRGKPDPREVSSATKQVGVHLHVFTRDAIRVASRHRRDVTVDENLHPVETSGRANLPALRRLLDESLR